MTPGCLVQVLYFILDSSVDAWASLKSADGVSKKPANVRMPAMPEEDNFARCESKLLPNVSAQPKWNNKYISSD